jgi:hypothetical protein
VFEAFDRREKQVADFLAGCAKKHGLPCNCGPSCRCRGCKCRAKGVSRELELSNQQWQQSIQLPASLDRIQLSHSTERMVNIRTDSGHVPPYAFRKHKQPSALQNALPDQQLPLCRISLPQKSPCCAVHEWPKPQADSRILDVPDALICQENRNRSRNLSVISSISGLSSIEWDNIPGFDVHEDHSAHIDPHIEDDLSRRLSIHSVRILRKFIFLDHVLFLGSDVTI